MGYGVPRVPPLRRNFRHFFRPNDSSAGNRMLQLHGLPESRGCLHDMPDGMELPQALDTDHGEASQGLVRD